MTFSPMEIIQPADIDYLKDKLLLPNGKLKLLEAKEYDSIDRQHLRLFCHQTGRYGLPTKELIDYIKSLCDGLSMIEIGAGNGDLGYHLGIPYTDSKSQQKNPEINLFYQATGQPVIQYPDDVEELEALDAVIKYRPDVVVASWVTQWIDPNKPMTRPGSNWGIRESEILKHVIGYLVLGNKKIHDQKFINKNGYKNEHFPFLRSRASSPEDDRLYYYFGHRYYAIKFADRLSRQGHSQDQIAEWFDTPIEKFGIDPAKMIWDERGQELGEYLQKVLT